MKKILWLFVLIVCVFGALYLYIDTDPPTISWGVATNDSINHALTIDIADDIGLEEVCFSMSGGACTGEERCSAGLQSQSFKLLIEPEQCLVNADPLEVAVTVSAADFSPVANKTSSSIARKSNAGPTNAGNSSVYILPASSMSVFSSASRIWPAR